VCVCVCVYVCAYVYMCVCVCVCVWGGGCGCGCECGLGFVDIPLFRSWLLVVEETVSLAPRGRFSQADSTEGRLRSAPCFNPALFLPACRLELLHRVHRPVVGWMDG